MSVHYLLLEPRPGASAAVRARLAELPWIAASQGLFGDQVAARAEAAADDLDDLVTELEELPEITWAAVYSDDGSEVSRRTVPVG